MKSAQKIKIIPMLFLLWALPMSMLARTVAKPVATAKPATTTPPNQAQLKLNATEKYGKLPLSFEANMGQSADQVQFLSRGKGYTLFLTSNQAVLSLRDKSSVLRMKLVGANAKAELSGQQQLQGKVNYLIGNDRSKWHTDIPTFRKVQYDDVWPGVDMLWYGSQSALEYDFVVNPGSEVSQIRITFEGAEKIRLDNEGNLIVTSKGEEVKHCAPVVYQGTNTVAGKYVLRGTNEIGFEVGPYD